jgi:predicted nucleotidyltransferase
MEDIKDRLGDYRYNYFANLQKYLDTELYFYGSIKRSDYFQNASDIDVTIITDNVNSILSKLQNYLNIKKSEIKKIYQKFYEKSKAIVVGYKIKYEDKERNFSYDILIYDEKYRYIVMENLNRINNLPTYMIVILVFVKLLYYTLGIISKDMYLYLKNGIFHMYFNKTICLYDRKKGTTIILDN